MRINNNISALNTYNRMSANTVNTSKSLEKLSSGLRINRAGDDAAGLAISEKMRNQIHGLDQASRNAQDGISLIQTGEGALNETHSILLRMRELAVQSASDTNTSADRANIDKEVQQLKTEIDRISNNTEFNTKKLLNGGLSKVYTATAQIANNTAVKNATAVISLIEDASGNALGLLTTDTITVNYYQGGVLQTAGGASYSLLSLVMATFSAAASVVTTVASSNVTITNSQTGTSEAIYGLTITVKDSTGLVKDAASSALSSFATTTQARNLSSNNSASIQIGANSNQVLSVDVDTMNTSNLGINGLVVTSQSGAETSINALDGAIQLVSTERSKLGALQNRLEHTISNLTTSSENLTAAESRIRDVDMAKEMSTFTKNNILTQAAQAMLAQANQQPQGVLQLLR